MRGHFAVGLQSREEGGVRGWRAWARPRGDSAVRPLSREEGAGIQEFLSPRHCRSTISRASRRMI